MRISSQGPSAWYLLLVIFMVGCGERGEDERVLSGEAMGTSWSLRYAGPRLDGLEQSITGRLEELEEIFSTWRDDSIVSRLNRGETLVPPSEYRRVFDLASELREKTDGVFDVTLGELVEREGFGSGISGRLDFSGIAKGFAVDEIGSLLESLGVRAFLFELGGELLGRGEREWRVGLESPDPSSVDDVRRVISLQDAAVATSGSYRLFRDGANHLIDPRTGRSIAHDCVSVSVVAESCAEADAFATALMVMGTEEGQVLAERLGLHAYFVRKLPDGGTEELIADYAD